MRKLLRWVDRISTSVGQLFAWLIVALTALITWEVVSRKLGTPHAWVFDAQIMLYGTLFMMAGAYTLAKNGHVRGDVLYGFFPPRLQAGIDLVLYVTFFVPGASALAWAGWGFAMDSWRIREHSSLMAEGPPVYPFKFIIPIAGALILLQGLAEIVRCVACLKNGEWPARGEDVVEVNVEELKEMVHVSDADLAAAEAAAAKAAAAKAEKEAAP